MNSYPDKLIQLAIEYENRPTGNISKHKHEIFQLLVQHTSFLPTTVTASVRLHHVRTNSHTVPTCKMCNNLVNWINTRQPHGYATYCSAKCNQTDPNTILTRKQTCLKKFGVESFSQTDQFKNTMANIDPSTWVKSNKKRKVTNMQTYGVDHVGSLPSVIKKRQATSLEKYGHTNILASDYVKQIKLEKYGTVGYSGTEAFKHAREKTMMERYGVLYGGENPKSIIKGKNTCNKLYGYEIFSQSHILKDNLDKSNDCVWLQEQHLNVKKPLSQIATELGVSLKTVQNRFKLYKLDIKRYNQSFAEHELVEFLTPMASNIKTSDRTVLNGRELDIYLPDYNIAIEYCGLYWHCDNHPNKNKHYHKQKFDMCKSKGIQLITIFEDEWLYNSDLVKATLLYKLGQSQTTSIPARKCEIKLIDHKTKREFLDQHHIQGNGPSSINVGLFHNNILVSCMGFIKQANNVYNLNRFTSSVPITGGFSKLLKYFIREYNPTQIISFADLRWSNGNMYSKAGFVLDKTLPPDYEYVDLHSMKRIHKFNFRHKNLPNILGKKYDSLLSETENTKNNNWFKIWNCGLLRYVMNF
jgi:hypothetical protein